MTARTYTTVLRYPARAELVVTSIPMSALAIYGGDRKVGLRRVLERLEPFEAYAVAEVGRFGSGSWGQALRRMVPDFAPLADAAEPSRTRASWPSASEWQPGSGMEPLSWEIIEWMTKALAMADDTDGESVDESVVASLLGDLQEARVIIAEDASLRRSSLGEFVGAGAVIVVIRHDVGPAAVVLAPAGVLLLHVVRPVSDVLEDAVKRWLSA